MTPPIQLVSEQNGAYVVCEEGRRFLAELRAGMSIAVVAVAGKYRTGKSFLLNRGVIGAPPRQGFATGSSVNACTKGIWLNPSLLYSCPSSNAGPFIVLDTEGTASLEASAEQDARLIGIAMAISSLFVYNSQGSVDEAAISDLATLTSVAGAISQDDTWSPPQLFWTLRDFALRLENEEGVALSSDEYLERALSEDKCGKADVRAALRTYFPKRRLFTLVRPCVDEVQLQKLNTMANGALRPEFRQQIEDFREQVRAVALKPKDVGGIGVDGAALLRLLEAAVAATNEGQVPSVRSTFTFLQERRCGQAVDEALEELRDAARAVVLPVPAPCLPTPEPPAFLRNLAEARQRFVDAVAKERDDLMATLLVRNAEATREVVCQAVAAMAGDCNFCDALQALRERVGGEAAAAAAPQLHAVVLERREEALRVLKSELLACSGRLSEVQDLMAAREGEVRRLRDELEEAVLARVPTLVVDNEETMAELRNTFVSEMAALAVQRDDYEARVTALSAELETAAGHAARAAALSAQTMDMQEHLSNLEMAEADSLADRQAELERVNRAHAADLETLQANFQQIVQQTSLRARSADEQRREALARAEALEARIRRADESVEQERAHAQDRCRAVMAEAEEQRRAASMALAQRAQLLKESHENVVAESQKARERAAAAERKLMTLEVQNESLKRRLDAAHQDGEELTKLRRLSEEQRARLSTAETAAERSSCAVDAQRRVVKQLEEELRAAQQRAQEVERGRTLRIAQLEMELQSRGVALPA